MIVIAALIVPNVGCFHLKYKQKMSHALLCSLHNNKIAISYEHRFSAIENIIMDNDDSI